jgi:dCTP deaminase
MYGGHLFAEVSATAFPELITPGETAMPQIRFYDGTPEALKGLALKVLLEQDPVLLDKNGKPIEFSRKDLDNICDSGVLSFSADFSGEFLAYRARKERKNIDLSKKDEYLPEDFFEEVKPKGKERSLVVHPGDFYLIHSMERIRLNPRMAAEIAEHSTELGDMKSHYAGLINCGHGYEQGKLTGANIVFEVRARDSPILIQHGQKIALFNLYKMSKAPEIKYSQVQSTGFYCLASILPTQFKKKEKKE